MKEKIINVCDMISIVSWTVTSMIMVVIQYLSMNWVYFSWTWNDLTRWCDSDTIIEMLYAIMVSVIILAGSSNLISVVIRKLSDTVNVNEEETGFDIDFDFPELEE